MSAEQKIPDDYLTAEIESLLRLAPDRHQLQKPSAESWSWLGRTKAALKA
jgi:hypothetical protein